MTDQEVIDLCMAAGLFHPPFDPYAGYPQVVIDRFERFHASNPQVYEEFVRLAVQMRGTGRKKYSARTIMEVIRWHVDLQIVESVFEVNNDFTPIYVRLLIRDRPEFIGFFELRLVKSRGIKSQEQREREGELFQ